MAQTSAPTRTSHRFAIIGRYRAVDGSGHIGTCHLFTWVGDAETGIARARAEGRERGWDLLDVWAEHWPTANEAAA